MLDSHGYSALVSYLKCAVTCVLIHIYIQLTWHRKLKILENCSLLEKQIKRGYKTGSWLVECVSFDIHMSASDQLGAT